MRKSREELVKFRKNFIRGICIVGMLILLFELLSPWFKLAVPLTNSIGGHLYLIVKNKIPQKGDLAAFWPPENKLYKNIYFIKYVKGVGGDVVTKIGTRFFINGEYIGEAKDKSSIDKLPLALNIGGLIAKDHYFMWTPHKESYDSRYKDIGYITTPHIMGVAYRIF